MAHREPAPLPVLQQTDAAGRPLPWPTFQVDAVQPQATVRHAGGTWALRLAPRAALRVMPSAALKGLVLALFAAGVVFGLAPARAWWLDGPHWLLGLLAVGAVGVLLGLDAALALVLLVVLAQAVPEIAAHPLPALLIVGLVVALRIGWDWLPVRRPR